jgi:hypothetical protein
MLVALAVVLSQPHAIALLTGWKAPSCSGRIVLHLPGVDFLQLLAAALVKML